MVIRLLLVLVVAGCSMLGSSPSPTKQASPDIWTKGDWFVRLVPQDKTAGKPLANAHPVNISPSRLATALSQVRIRGNVRGKSYPLFNQESLDILSVYVSEALSKATATDDVVFAVGTYQRRVLGLRTDLAATGRVFNNQDGLNVILGELREPNLRYDSEAELKALNKDTRLNPYIPGLRGIRQTQEQRLTVPQAASGVFTKTKNRPDWFVFTERALVARQPAQGQGLGRSAGVPAGQESELARLKREVEELKSRIGGSNAGRGNAIRGDGAGGNRRQMLSEDAIRLQQGWRPPSVETKLEALKNLREQGLISEEDYAKKRAEILASF